MYKLTSWSPALTHEGWLPLLAQGDTVIEKGMDAVMKGGTDFGNSTDAVRFGIILFALLAVVGALAYLKVAGDRATIRELKSENKGLRDEIKANLHSYENHYEEMRVHYETLTRGYWGTLGKMITEFSTLNRVLEERGLIMRRPLEPEALPPPPAQQSPPSKVNFLTQRRIPPKSFGDNRSDPTDNK